MLPAWVYLITVLVATNAYTFKRLYPTAAARAQLVATGGGNPALRFLYGRLNGSSIGALTAWRYGVWAAIFGALMTVFIVVRHTRGDEEAGRLELVGSAAVGRQAALTAGLLTAVTANVAISALLCVVLPACRAAGLRLGRARAGHRRERAGVHRGRRGRRPARLRARAARGGSASACSAPRSCSARSATRPAERPVLADLDVAAGLGGADPAVRRPAVVGAGAAVRGAGGGSRGGLRPLRAARLGAGLLPDRPGRPSASGLLRGPLGLAWRLQRGLLGGWAAGVAFIFAASGAAAKGIGSLLGGSTQLRNEFTRLGGQAAITNAYLAALMLLAGLGAAGYATSAVLRLRTEETGGLAEPLLATAVGRIRWGLSQVAVAVFGAAVLLALAGLATGLGYGLRDRVARPAGGADARRGDGPAARVPGDGGSRGRAGRAAARRLRWPGRGPCSAWWSSSTCSARPSSYPTGCWTSHRSRTPRSSPAGPCPPRRCSGCASPPSRSARSAWPRCAAATSARSPVSGIALWIQSPINSNWATWSGRVARCRRG